MSFRFFTRLEDFKSRASSSRGELCPPFCLNAAVYPYYHPHLASGEEEGSGQVNPLFLSHNRRTLSFKSIGVSTCQSRISSHPARMKQITNVTIKPDFAYRLSPVK